ncbi:MAG: methyltransferase domain-containing protein [Oligoflexia bacterium]|nr:methyltransferase domain-containing protein [Oligoflexia bacterium]MBF0365789.1 methyltransferase domain-containing protein [Oligoflexia bacterium]
MENNFNYSEIPNGHYDDIYHHDHGMRGFWHWSKFETVKKMVIDHQLHSRRILDIGCFSGTFLGTLSERDFAYQLGVDILESQIHYARKKYCTNFREFAKFDHLDNICTSQGEALFDVVTVIEVIEHLRAEEITALLKSIHRLLRPGGDLIITTPNYFSLWPLLEYYLNRFSDISYKEQHITKFTYLNFEKKLSTIMQGDLKSLYALEMMTTSHLITPFIAKIHYPLAKKLATIIKARHWKIGIGPLLVVKLQRR